MTQVFPFGRVEIMHLEKGSFKFNAQRLKPYFGGTFHASKQSINLSTLETVHWEFKQNCSLKNIEIQESLANDIKQNASWEAT